MRVQDELFAGGEPEARLRGPASRPRGSLRPGLLRRPFGESWQQRLNINLDLQSLFGLLSSLAETPQLPPPPAFGLVYEGAIGQPR